MRASLGWFGFGGPNGPTKSSPQPKLHPIHAMCPICKQSVRLRHNKAGRRHVLAHLREFYRFCWHLAGFKVCKGSGKQPNFHPHPQENEYYKPPSMPDLETLRQRSQRAAVVVPQAPPALVA